MNNKIHYLDEAATAIPCYRVSNFNGNWLNPNSHYSVNSFEKFQKCEELVKNSIGAKSGKVVFGGNASYFFEMLFNIYGNFWYCGHYEHDCVNKYGAAVDYNTIEDVENEIYCHQFVNNITGEIFPVEKIGKNIKDSNGFFVCDATAGLGKATVPEGIDKWCDAFVMSSHKLGVDNKQIGCAWISDSFYNWFCLEGTVANGYGFVFGTPDLACAKATTQTIFDTVEAVDKNNEKYNTLYLETCGLLEEHNIKYEGVHAENRTAAINAIMLYNLNANALCNYLASKSIYISPGHSACEKDADYRVLTNYGLTRGQCESTIRVSFGPHSNMEDIRALVDGIVSFRELYS